VARPVTKTRPVIGLTSDVVGEPTGSASVRYQLASTYAGAVWRAGGTPIVLPALTDYIDQYVNMCDGFVLTGGDDPRTEPFGGVPTHPKAKLVHPDRQEFETVLLERLSEHHRDMPVLGVCLGMQMMALVAGGRLNQHLPDDWPTHDDHWGRGMHEVHGDLGAGVVESHHRQAVSDPGGLRVVASAHDGLIEAVRDVDRAFYLGVQWHPERMGDGDSQVTNLCHCDTQVANLCHSGLGDGLFGLLVGAC